MGSKNSLINLKLDIHDHSTPRIWSGGIPYLYHFQPIHLVILPDVTPDPGHLLQWECEKERRSPTKSTLLKKPKCILYKDCRQELSAALQLRTFSSRRTKSTREDKSKADTSSRVA
ncbi:hypothetical protein AVEN_111647-1 [Araneus ventricosus]|uniref:Uncharacterized protein n=1 Tax=Araneus ventricosus TaxID=182803 RepID=A0A4Y2C466_ARAVE|nr:hypothetical protein AVEN_111647-1 [Araneus ventricosus]